MTKILTQRGIDAAKPATKRYGVKDGLIPGLRCLVFPSGQKTFALFTRVGGRLTNTRIGSANLLTLAEARAKSKAVLLEIANGGDPRAAKQDAKQAAAETVAVVVQRFVERYVQVRNKRHRDVQQRLEREILPRWGRWPINSVKRADVVELLDSIVDRGAPISANRLLASIRKLFNWCVERGTLDTSPCDRVKAPAREVKRDRVLADAELALVWRAAETLGYPFGPFIRLLVLTGQRREEIAAMRWSEFDSDLSVWTLPAARAKNDTSHSIPIVPAAAAILTSLPRLDGSDFLFTTTGTTPISGYSRAKHDLDLAIASLNGGISIAPWVLHDLRRTMATTMPRLGAVLPTVERILNHISGPSFGGVQGIYQRFDFSNEKRDALGRWADHVLALASRP